MEPDVIPTVKPTVESHPARTVQKRRVADRADRLALRCTAVA